MNPRKDDFRKNDILKAIDAIYELRRHLIKYSSDENIESIAFAALSYNLIVIGEATNHLSDEYKNSNPTVAWQAAIAWRNQLAHQYFAVDLNTVEAIIEEFLAELASILER